MRTLVLVHGRAQEHKDPLAVKQEWLSALDVGAHHAGRPVDLPDDRVRLPYYGQTLFDLVAGDAEHATEVVVRGAEGGPDAETLFVRETLLEIAERAGVAEDAAREAAADAAVERGPMNWRWVRATLTALDRLPNVSAWSIALATRDVYQYLHNVRVRDTIEDGVRQALDGTEGAVVVSHSLGTVVAYNLLRREAGPRGWDVPLLVTLGSPLGVTNISRTLRPVSWPDPVGAWFNAYDPEDLVALHPLTAPWFPVDRIDDYGKVDNPTSNQHGISGYLSDSRVAATILEALAG
ncbi:hypothetical protein MHY85_16120 [Cellulomonas sp. ACRRI]|uniref:hypothetical protein n=1 Tax=Cellulomonas sp. ACRRI TaxID=2918188 RepID=UPI001EF32A1A|nr:hypothetical protein [Cellulomonas sp. ACRRI]MCG7287493.1 hypothetical protein [Cellulomonas sp. ACRRI]